MIRLALVGLGRMGRRWWPHLLASRRFRLVAVVDPVAPDATHRALYDAPAFDAAIVATPTLTHFAAVQEAFQTGVRVLVEKPIAATWADAQRLAHDFPRSLVVGHVERFNPAVRAFLEAVRSGIVGAPMHAGAFRSGPRPERVAPGDHALLDLGVHDLDLLRCALGPLDVTAATVQPDAGGAALRSESGVPATVNASWGLARRRALWCLGQRGHLWADLLAGSVTLDGRPLPVPPGDALAAQLDAFADLIETGDGGALCSAEDGAEAVRLVEEATATGASATRATQGGRAA